MWFFGKSGILLSLLIGFSQIVQEKKEKHYLTEFVVNISAH